MEKSETLSKLATSLSIAQGDIDDASKNGLNPAFRSKYADLAAVRTVIREPLSVNGLSVLQFASTVLLEGSASAVAVEVRTMLLHNSGEYVSEVLRMPVMKQDSHGVGSAITYARRYGLMGILCIASEDDDGNAASNVTQGGKAPAPVVKIPEATLKKLKEDGMLIAKEGIAKVRSWYKALSPELRMALEADDYLTDIVASAPDSKKD